MELRKILFAFILIISILGNADFSVSGGIKGKVHFRTASHESPRTVPRYNQPASIEIASKHREREIKAVAYIADAFPDSAFALPSENPVLDQRNEQFIPYILPVLVGTNVDFPNNDRIYHNVFSFSRAKTFDLGKYPTKTKKTVTFDKEGIVSIFCEIHSHMNAFIVVLPNSYFSVIRADGRFEIPNIPPGNYTLKVFAGRGEEIERKISVKESEFTQIELSF